MKKTGAVIVGAGLSSRMQSFKPLLPFKNSTISHHLVTTLKRFGLDPIVVVCGYRAEDLMEHLSSTGVRFIKNERYRETQMFDSVKMGIEAIADECDRIMIMPLDIPAIRDDTYREVLRIDCDMIRTLYQGRPGHPILLKKQVALDLCHYEGDGGLRGAMEHSKYGLTNLEVDDEGVRRDIDTKEDYQKLIEWNYQRGEGYPMRPALDLTLCASEPFFSNRTLELLKNIERFGSIQEACEHAELSYSKGSRMIKKIEEETGIVVVQRWTGGAGGGGANLTEKGMHLVQQYSKLFECLKKCMEENFEKIFIEDIL